MNDTQNNYRDHGWCILELFTLIIQISIYSERKLIKENKNKQTTTINT